MTLLANIWPNYTTMANLCDRAACLSKKKYGCSGGELGSSFSFGVKGGEDEGRTGTLSVGWGEISMLYHITILSRYGFVSMCIVIFFMVLFQGFE